MTPLLRTLGIGGFRLGRCAGARQIANHFRLGAIFVGKVKAGVGAGKIVVIVKVGAVLEAREATAALDGRAIELERRRLEGRVRRRGIVLAIGIEGGIQQALLLRSQDEVLQRISCRRHLGWAALDRALGLSQVN